MEPTTPPQKAQEIGVAQKADADRSNKPSSEIPGIAFVILPIAALFAAVLAQVLIAVASSVANVAANILSGSSSRSSLVVLAEIAFPHVLEAAGWAASGFLAALILQKSAKLSQCRNQRATMAFTCVAVGLALPLRLAVTYLSLKYFTAVKGMGFQNLSDLPITYWIKLLCVGFVCLLIGATVGIAYSADQSMPNDASPDKTDTG